MIKLFGNKKPMPWKSRSFRKVSEALVFMNDTNFAMKKDGSPLMYVLAHLGLIVCFYVEMEK